ncbi:hypothetical protein MMSR116_02265 [Methylobacterium mesophilicum SR1.6/6]|uniref:Isopropylmalate dehydrogenase-like domain-containing protein n=1 Tax=Methylobacterium mesophilicum SR1.6/6 TaxID=908290 RepID=A0A6B9FEN0_9HYPH|nr:isocitrate/isopropylmalate family dehydrogenase [Methylobacterium mesophilicum]QGY00859.1 hypothetical protein MMSR116_02265 [Methylobacterium mesophilicum SR1.6/6]
MYGNILSNLANALAGSLGLASALNVGHACAAANAGHGSAPDIAGRNIANPLGLLLSAAALLDWHGGRTGRENFRTAARGIEQAIDRALVNPATRTGDLGGGLGTQAFAEALCDEVEQRLRRTQ